VIVYHFFGPIELFYEKGTERVLFKVFFRLYQHEKPPSFLSLDSLNKHRKTHMGLNHSFLGFIKNTLRDSSEGGAYITSICYPPQDCIKIKRYLLENGGGKFWKEMCLCTCVSGSTSLS
jgi:hypothetical protein